MRKRLLSVLTGAALVLSLTTACQASPPDIAAEQAKAFQSRVLEITTSVADGGYAAALEALTALETELDGAAADGSVSFARHQRIEAALTAVRADIQAAIDAQAEPEPAPAEPAAPVEEEEAAPDTETDAEKKAREADEKAAEDARKAAEEAQKKADEKAAEDAKKAAEDAKKAAEDAKKKAAEDAKDNGTSPSNNNGNGG